MVVLLVRVRCMCWCIFGVLVNRLVRVLSRFSMFLL